MPHPIQALLFDLDGVIVDTARYHFLAWRRLANELGFDFDAAFNERLKGVGRMESLDLILDEGGIMLPLPRKEKLAELKNKWYNQYLDQMTPAEILPGVVPFLDRAREIGLQLAVTSGSKNAGRILRQLELRAYFDVLVDGNDVMRSKPDPQVFELGAEGLGRRPRECVVFEDAVAGVEAARRGGFYVVGVGDEQVLGAADLVIPGFEGVTPEDLLKRLSNH